MLKSVSFMVFAASLALSQPAIADEGMNTSESWLRSLITDSPEQGFNLAVKLSRVGVKTTQPDIDVLKTLRESYARNPDSLIAASHVVAVHFQTIAAANNYWRK